MRKATDCFWVWTKLLPLHGCDVMCFEVMCLWSDALWRDVPSCEVICGELTHCGYLRLVMLCAVMSFHVTSFHDVVFCLLRSIMSFGRGVGSALSFCCRSALSRAAVVTPRGGHVIGCDVTWCNAMSWWWAVVSSTAVGWNVISFARPRCVFRSGSVTMW